MTLPVHHTDALKFAKERDFNGYSDTRSVQENFNLITSFIQDSADKHIPSKTSRSVSSVPWITPAIRRKIRRKNTTHAKAKKSGSAKIRAKFETLRREIKADIRKQHDLYVNNLVGDVKANPKDFYRYINSQKKDALGIPPLKKRNGGGVAQSESEKAAEFNGQFTDVFTKSEYSQDPLLDRSAPFMEDIVVTKEGVTKLLKGLNPSKALGPDELHPRVLKELATKLGPIFARVGTSIVQPVNSSGKCRKLPAGQILRKSVRWQILAFMNKNKLKTCEIKAYYLILQKMTLESINY